MAVKQDDFWHLFASDLAFATQAQHVFGVLSLALVPHACLAGKERFKTFLLQAIKQCDGRDVGVAVRAGFVLVVTKYTGNMEHQFVVRQWTVAANLVNSAKAPCVRIVVTPK